jgi:hypothetical protein
MSEIAIHSLQKTIATTGPVSYRSLGHLALMTTSLWDSLVRISNGILVGIRKLGLALGQVGNRYTE